ncbi:MAG TPA: hypothetical protein ENL00_03405 [Nitratifractor sp.]|nr:hypothetical protein [Nitratifractor sp.]
MSFFNSKNSLLLLHKSLEGVKKAARYDLVLSPQFYIVKRETVPVKYSFQAKKLAPSIMDDMLPADYGYEYVVKKDGDSWLFFAYAPKEIEEFLQNCCNIPPHRIGKIYFADQLKEVLQKLPVGINNDYALTLVDGFATIVPRSMLQSEKYAKFTPKLRPKHSVNFKQTSKFDKESKLEKTTAIVAALLFLLGVFFFIDGFGYKRAADKEEAKLNTLYEEYPQLQSKLVRESIKEKYENIEKRQRSIRQLLDSFSQLTSKKTLIDRLELKPKSISGRFLIDPAEKKRVMSVATGADLKVKEVNPAIVEVEGELK